MDIQQAYTETIDLLKTYGLYEQGWRFELGRGKRRLGSCNHRRKKISVSRYHVVGSSDADVIDTIRHEVAHALAGPGKGHGSEWKTWAIKLGASPRARSKRGPNVHHRYELVCDHCDRVVQHRHNRINPNRLVRLRHTACGERGTLFVRFNQR